MTLSDRLTRLRCQTGDSAVQTLSLAARVARLRRQSTPASGSAAGDAELARRLKARRLDDGLVLLEEDLSLAAAHGDWPLQLVVQQSNGLAGFEDIDPQRLVFLDTETSGLSSGCGNRVFLLGLARLAPDRLQMRQYLLSRLCGEAAMIEAAESWLQEGDILVSYNGKTFDIPLLGSRCRLARKPDPFTGRRHIDLLYPLRRAFARRWPDCRLATAEARLLGFHRHNDLPGSQAPVAWFDWLRRGDYGRLPGVCRHNRWDLLSLVTLLPVVSLVYLDPGRFAADIASVARAQMRSGRDAQALRLLRDGRRHLDQTGLLELARLCRRQGDWRQSLAIWEELAAKDNAQAIEHLAKYYEHVTGDYAQALRHARRLPPLAAHQHRQQRLCLKLAAGRP